MVSELEILFWKFRVALISYNNHLNPWVYFIRRTEKFQGFFSTVLPNTNGYLKSNLNKLNLNKIRKFLICISHILIYSHLWLVATMLDRTVIDIEHSHHPRKFYCRVLLSSIYTWPSQHCFQSPWSYSICLKPVGSISFPRGHTVIEIPFTIHFSKLNFLICGE